MGVETDTGRWKIGTGYTAWNSLPYKGDPGATVYVAASVAGPYTPTVTLGAVHEITLTGDSSLVLPDMTGLVTAVTLTLTIVQDATGGRAFTWPGGIRWASGVVPALPTSAGAESDVTLLWTPGRGWRGFVSGAGMA